MMLRKSGWDLWRQLWYGETVARSINCDIHAPVGSWCMHRNSLHSFGKNRQSMSEVHSALETTDDLRTSFGVTSRSVKRPSRIVTVKAAGTLDPEERNLEAALEERQRWKRDTRNLPDESKRRNNQRQDRERNEGSFHDGNTRSPEDPDSSFGQRQRSGDRFYTESIRKENSSGGRSINGPGRQQTDGNSDHEDEEEKNLRVGYHVSAKGANSGRNIHRELNSSAPRMTVPSDKVKSERLPSSDEEDNEPKTAYDIVKKIRNHRDDIIHDKSAGDGSGAIAGSKKRQLGLDSNGFKTYKHLVPNWDRLAEDDVALILKRSIIYDEHGIVALNKPYGLPVHGGPKIHHCVTRYLPQLAEALRKDGNVPKHLYLVNRIDKETTGVLLLARDASTAAKLNNMLVHRRIKKEYWALTKGVPQPLKGIIDIPIGDSRVTGVNRRVLRPMRTDVTRLVMNKSSLGGDQAITKYEVLGSSGSCALVRSEPQTGVQHQVRLHLAHAMSCPVLGEYVRHTSSLYLVCYRYLDFSHKYSHFTRLVPQRLPSDMLKRLKIRQAKVRTVPMCLHAKSVVIPEFVGAENIFISADLPGFFLSIMAKLKVKANTFD